MQTGTPYWSHELNKLIDLLQILTSVQTILNSSQPSVPLGLDPKPEASSYSSGLTMCLCASAYIYDFNTFLTHKKMVDLVTIYAVLKESIRRSFSGMCCS